MTVELELQSLEKRFGAQPVTRGVSLSVRQSEIVALLGPSGSGKTTVLRLVAGFETPDSGRIVVGGEDVTDTPPERRRFGMVFQHYALFPHMSVGENVAFGLEPAGISRAEAPGRVRETLAVVDLAGFEDRRVTELSGGQQQRVALARALAPRPRVLLLDEPLSNLDPTLRDRTRRELKRVIRRVGITTLFVTHEQEEAFELGDRIAVLHGGRLEQVGAPEELYEQPATRFVATFIGRSSVLPVLWRAGSDGRGAAEFPGDVRWPAVSGGRLPDGGPAHLVARPEGLALGSPGQVGALIGEVIERRYAGRVAFYTVRLADSVEAEVLAPPDAAKPGDAVGVVPARDAPPPRAYAPDPIA
ncbi:MAG: ABC transporter ATP-binding protein [Acidobacteria bacterium]|nr:ABC transporter ATP-binding protein [Acidobacteriota bacterium]MCA1610087.1 ABC transporter ATP-binding protein [Acidobacteriota bacterium]